MSYIHTLSTPHCSLLQTQMNISTDDKYDMVIRATTSIFNFSISHISFS